MTNNRDIGDFKKKSMFNKGLKSRHSDLLPDEENGKGGTVLCGVP